MKKIFCFLVLVIATLFCTSNAKAQSTSVELNFRSIESLDQRLLTLHHLQSNDNLRCYITESPSVLAIVSTENIGKRQLQRTVDQSLQNANEEYQEYLNMDKEMRGALFATWKEELSDELYIFILKDILERNRENGLCRNADPFCTDNIYDFPAGVNSGTGESGPNYNCLGSTPNPAWYYMRIGNPGNINIYMYSTPSKDIDFCCWGPFSDPVEPCPNQLTLNKVVSCSYSTSSTETCLIPSTATTGEYYILIITNYSNSACNIHFQKNGGTGTTDCSIMPPLISYNDPVCVGGTISLRAEEISGASYSWTGPGGWTSTQRNPTRPNATMSMAGTYTCQITVGSSQSDPISLVVEVHPMPIANFTYTQVCKGNPTTFTCTSTTNPSGQQITSRTWNFGDGTTGAGQQINHTYNNSGTYTVKLTVKTAGGVCSSEKTQQVVVYSSPNANAGNDQTIGYGATATLSGSGGSGSFTYHWSPENKVVNPNAQTTQTVPLTQNQVFTFEVTSTTGNCYGSDQVTVAIQGGSMTATASADNTELCEGESTQLHANPMGGSGNYTYSWTPAATLNNPTSQNPIATPNNGTTTYVAHISDNITSQDVQVEVTCHPNETKNISASVCANEIYDFFGDQLTEPGTYSHTIESSFGCDSIVTMNLALNYTPFISEIKGRNWVVAGTDLQINIYDYQVEQLNPNCQIDSIKWEISCGEWGIEPLDNGKCCKLYVTTWEPDSVELKVTSYNGCGIIEKSMKLLCTFYGTEEAEALSNINIIPNPNNGKMTLQIDEMQGTVNVKVYNMSGLLVDDFNFEAMQNQSKYEYSLEGKPEGIYLFNIMVQNKVVTQKVLLLRH